MTCIKAIISNPPPQEMMALMQVIYAVVGLFIVVGTVMNILAGMFRPVSLAAPLISRVRLVIPRPYTAAWPVLRE